MAARLSTLPGLNEQELWWQDRAEVVALFKENAVVYVCGDGQHMVPAVRAAFVQMYQEAVQSSPEEAEARASEVERSRTRYVADVFAQARA